MVIRGAPAIGVAAAMGAVSAFCILPQNPWKLSALNSRKSAMRLQKRALPRWIFLALERMKRRSAELTAATSDLGKIGRDGGRGQTSPLEKKATDEAIGGFGAEFMPARRPVMTHATRERSQQAALAQLSA